MRGRSCYAYGSQESHVFLDDGADVNIVSRAFALQHDLPAVEEARLPQNSCFEGHSGYCYGAYAVRIRLADSGGEQKETIGVFYPIDRFGPDVILGRLWPRQQAVVVDSRTVHWRY